MIARIALGRTKSIPQRPHQMRVDAAQCIDFPVRLADCPRTAVSVRNGRCPKGGQPKGVSPVLILMLQTEIAVLRFGLGARTGDLTAASGDPRGWLRAQTQDEVDLRA
jgi:hypothetical protein